MKTWDFWVLLSSTLFLKEDSQPNAAILGHINSDTKIVFATSQNGNDWSLEIGLEFHDELSV